MQAKDIISVTILNTRIYVLCALVLSFSSNASIRGFIQKPIGDFTNFSIAGWACEVGKHSPVNIDLLAGTSFDNAEVIHSTMANKDSEIAIAQRCASDGRHRFVLSPPQSVLHAHAGKFLFVKSDEQQILGKHQYRLPDHPASRVKGFFDGIVEKNNTYFASGWACQTYFSEALKLRLIARDTKGARIELTASNSGNVVAESAVSKSCGTSANKLRYRIKIPPESIELYANRPLQVEAQSLLSNDWQLLPSARSMRVPDQFASQQARKPNIILYFTDDQGFADVGYHQARDDIHTPNIDQLAHGGAIFNQGYVTAPQCSPSRAAMLTGVYQNRLGLDENQHIPMTREVKTLATRLKNQGYQTGMMGKWHLEVMSTSKEWGAKFYPEIQPFKVAEVPKSVLDSYLPHKRGFDSVLAGYTGQFWRNINHVGKSIEPELLTTNQFRVDLTNEYALSFIDQYWDQPFFLYVAPYAPHTPLRALQKYLDEFPADMPQRRRYALAMLSAIDKGVGDIVDKLAAFNLLDNTLIFFISDNGAPLGDDMTDTNIGKRETWNGSRNDPFTGEKGMLTEGALRVPFVAHWPEKIDPGTVVDSPVSSLDAAYTIAEAAGINDVSDLDGMSLLPLINGESSTFNERPLFWRFYYQRAVRKGQWKYMQAGIKREYLFDLSQTDPESINLIKSYPEKANELKELYWKWAEEMPRPEPLVEIPKPFAERVDRYLPTQ